jgi:hypothetical protein
MKKLPILLALMVSLTVYAQQEKGDLAIQFSGNYYSQKITVKGETQRSLFGNIYVKVGKLFTDNLELGVKPNVNFTMVTEYDFTQDNPKPKEKLVTNVGFGIYGTYSFLTSDGKFLPYAGAEISYVPLQEEATINLGPYAGVKYFVTERINIDGNFSFLANIGSTVEQPKDDYKIGPLFMYNIGIGVILGRLND